MRQWYRDELVPLLHRAGFATVDVHTGVDQNTLVYVARRGASLPLATRRESIDRCVCGKPGGGDRSNRVS
jgi:hypothetical protein